MTLYFWFISSVCNFSILSKVEVITRFVIPVAKIPTTTQMTAVIPVTTPFDVESKEICLSIFLV